MTLEKIKCKDCGAMLTRENNSNDIYVCEHCGAKQVLKQDAIVNNYNIKQDITKNIFGENKKDYSEMIEACLIFIKLEEYDRAIKLASMAIDEMPGNYMAWWLSAKAKILLTIKEREGNKINIFKKRNDYEEDYKKAKMLAQEQDVEAISLEYGVLVEKLSQNSMAISMNVEANFKAQKLQKKLIPGFILLGISLICLACFIYCEIADFDGAESLMVVFALFFVMGLAILSEYRTDKKVLEIVNNEKRISVSELIKRLENINVEMSYEKATNKIISLIENGYLCGYEASGDDIIQIEQTHK